MQTTDETSTRNAALAAVKKDGGALNQVNPKLKDDISFAWAISRIQSDHDDEIRKKYITRFVIQESLKLFVSFATVAMSSLLILGVFLFPLPSLAGLIVASLFASSSVLYILNKLYQHFQGFFKAFIQTQGVDRLSSLPKAHIHEILTYLPIVESQTQGVVRLSLFKAHIHEPLIYFRVSDRINFGSVSKRMYGLFQEKRLLNKFLQRVAFGMQDKVEQLFREVYRGDVSRIQEALQYQGQFTDYSGRSFDCTAYEYAYWAKDTHMCHMLERYMDDETKAHLLARINENDATGLCYQQNGEEHRSAHFDLTPLIEAYQRYLAGINAWYAAGALDAIDAAWFEVGKAQRNVPAHVAQEYCRPDRSFYPRPKFNEETLPRGLTFFNWLIFRHASWFPLAGPSSGLGFDFSLLRGCYMGPMWPWAYIMNAGRGPMGLFVAKEAQFDLAAITFLDEVRTAQLTQSREHLNSPALSHSLSI